MLENLISLVIDHQTNVIIVSVLLVLLSVLIAENRISKKRKAKEERNERRYQERLNEVNNSIRLKVAQAEKRQKKDPVKKSILVSGVTVEELDARALHKALKQLRKEGKSDYDPDKTIQIYYVDKFDPSKLGKENA